MECDQIITQDQIREIEAEVMRIVPIHPREAFCINTAMTKRYERNQHCKNILKQRLGLEIKIDTVKWVWANKTE